ncbi:MAG: signal peptidase I [Nitrososphaerota archaeon]|nr:signal peptidase I [Nitrososphaerota archaeon]
MKLLTKGNWVYVALVVFLLFWSYFVQTDARRVDGVSMLPTLEGGDLVVIQNVPISTVHVGDIIVYGGVCSSSGVSVVHRVVQVTSQGLITKGDDNRTNPRTDQALGIATSPITQQCLEGKVVMIIPYIELLAYYIDSHNLPQWLNYIPSIVILLVVWASLIGVDRDEDERKPPSKE